jgi:GDPmannose 4,6-dehydratase
MRGETFVTRKITRGLARIKLNLQECLYLGNIYSKRDWGHAKDFVEMQWMMLQAEEPEDYVIATGHQQTVKDFINIAADFLGMTLKWRGVGLNEVAEWREKIIIKIDPRYFRPTEVDSLLGDSSKARNKLGWNPKISFTDLVHEMVANDLRSAEVDALVKKHGYSPKIYHE